MGWNLIFSMISYCLKTSYSTVQSMGENGGCLQSCQKCCFKRFKSVHTQATVLQSCQLKLLTLNLFKRCETKQLRTNFIDNSRVMLQKKTKWRMLWRKWINLRTFWGSSNSSSSSNTLMSAAETTMFYYDTSTLGNIPRHIWGHCYQQ